MTVQLQVLDGSHSASEVAASVTEILTGRDLLTLATYSPGSGPHANSAFFGFDEDLTLWFVSERTTRHSLNIATEPRVSASVFLDPPTYGEGLRGVQLEGTAREATADERHEALAVTQARFPAFAEAPGVRDGFLDGTLPAAFYRIDVGNLVVLDEPRFGRRVYLQASVQH